MGKGFNKYLNHISIYLFKQFSSLYMCKSCKASMGKLLDDNIYYIIYVSFVQSCFLITSVNFSVVNDDYPGGSHCGVATLQAHFIFPG